MDLDVLKSQIYQAKTAMRKELERRYPEGSLICVALNCRQKTPTWGKAVGHDGDGYVQVRIDSAKDRSRRSVRNVHYSRIFGTQASHNNSPAVTCPREMKEFDAAEAKGARERSGLVYEGGKLVYGGHPA